MTNPILETKNLGIDFGGLTAVNNLSIHINEKEIVGLIGPNGAGKTTVFNLLTKVYEPTRGKILLCGNDLEKNTILQANVAGIARTFQNIRLFDILSVIDNVKVAMNNHYHYSLFDTMFHTKKYKNAEKEIEEDRVTIIATGPLTSENLTKEIGRLTGQEQLHFYDAAAPIILRESINFDIAFYGDRYVE